MEDRKLLKRYQFDCRRIEFEDAFHIEYCITDICNRNCAACSHLAPLAKSPNFVTCEEFEKNVVILHKLLPEAHTFLLTGGEPTLHPKFIPLLEIAAKVFANSFVGIYSNGSFLDGYKNDLNFWQFVRERGIVWAVTNYDAPKSEVENIFSQNGCLNNLAFVHSGNTFFNLTNYSCNQPVTEEKYKNCGWERSKINVRNGKIFNCPSAEFVDLFNAHFNCDLRLTDEDFLTVDDRLTREQIENFRGATPFCGNCDLNYRYKKIFKNSQSKRQISEWSTF